MTVANRKTKRVLKLDEFQDQAIEAIGQTPGVTLELEDGSLLTIPHPMLVTDEQQTEIERVQNGDDLDEDGKINGQTPEVHAVRFARAVLGEERHKAFLAGGGKSVLVMLAWQMLTKELEEKGPKLPR
jgi:hypothetical protein